MKIGLVFGTFAPMHLGHMDVINIAKKEMDKVIVICEGDDIVLMDYKTDKVKEPSELIRRYQIQLDLYKRALEAATNKKVKEVYIYSFGLGCQIKL